MNESRFELNPVEKQALETLRSHPAAIHSMLSQNEYSVFVILAKSKHGLSVRDVRRRIAEQALLKRKSEWAFDEFPRAIDALIEKKKKAGKLNPEETISYFREIAKARSLYKTRNMPPIWGDKKAAEFLSTVPVELTLHIAAAFGIPVIFEATVKNALDLLVERGIAGKTIYPPTSRERAAYFINPALAEIKGFGVVRE